ncbi:MULTISPECIES: hypothetical protein [Streptomyces]
MVVITSWVALYGTLAVIWHLSFDYSWAESIGFGVAVLAFQVAAHWWRERRQQRRTQAAPGGE